MIGKIKGRLTDIDGSIGYIETNSGISYRVHIPPLFLSKKYMDTEISLYTHHHIREDDMSLYGFEKKETYHLFCDLIKVSGVGPKIAFLIVIRLSHQELIHSMKVKDISVLTSVPGLGKKTALKIILDLSQKYTKDIDITAFEYTEEEQTIIDGLTSLGFPQQNVQSIIRQIPSDISLEEKIKEGIKLVSKK